MDEKQLALAAVALRTAIKYRKNWNKNSPTVKLLQNLMPTAPGARKGYRLYMDMTTRAHRHYSIPPAVRSALKRAGFVATDYLAKKCVKLTDKEQRNEFNIGKVIAKDALAKAAFDNDPQLQNSNTASHQVVFSCHPYDVIGMSTGRAWDKQSCMRLDDGKVNKGDSGAYHQHVGKDVAEGTIVAYAIASTDTNIKHPKCRILIKPYRNKDGKILYHEESSIYGNPVAGFRAVVKRFLKQINAEVPTGYFKLVKGLYEDGAPTEINHDPNKHAADHIPLEAVQADLELLEPFIEQELKAGADSEYSAKTVFDLLDRLSTNIDGIGEIHDTQIHNVAKMLRGNERQRDVFQSEFLINNVHNPVLAEIAREAGFLDGELPEVSMPDKILRRMAVRGGKNLDNLWTKTGKIDIWDEDDHTIRETLNQFLKGILQLPSKEVMEQDEQLRTRLYTLASALRYMPLFGNTEYEKGVYKIMDRYHEDFPHQEKELDEYVFDLMRHVVDSYSGNLCLLLDNDQALTNDLFWYVPANEAGRLLTTRRVFRAMQKLKHNQTQRYMDDISSAILGKYLAASKFERQNYKQVLPDVLTVIRAQPELVDQIGNVGWDEIIHFAEIAPDLLMKYNVQSFALGDKLGDVLSGLIGVFNEYQGEKLEPETMPIEYLVQVACYADSICDRPLRIKSKFNIDEWWDSEKLERAYTTFSARPWKLHMPLSGYLTRVQVNGQRPDITNDREMMLHEGPESFGSVFFHNYAAAVRPLMKTARMFPMVGQCVSAVGHVVHGLDYEEIADLEEYVDDAIRDVHFNFDADKDGTGYQKLRDELRDKAWEEIERARRRNAARVEAMEYVQSLIGTDESGAREFLSQYEEDNFEFSQALHDMSEIQETLQTNLENTIAYNEENE